MVKPDAEVIKEFNDLVNMSASELEKWLKSSDSISSGWKNGDSGETVGHNSGTKIIDILKRNPDKKKDKYTEEDIKHMRKVVSYNKRHLAQERHLKEKKGEEELKKTKSYKSLKNDPSSSSSSTQPQFKSDAPLPTALNLGRIGTASTTASTLAASSTTSSSSAAQSSKAYLDGLEESVNKTIDGEIENLLSSYKELVMLAGNLTLLSESLKLSLLLSKTPDPALNDEALELIESTEREKMRVASLLAEVLGLDAGESEELVKDLDTGLVDKLGDTEMEDDELMEDLLFGYDNGSQCSAPKRTANSRRILNGGRTRGSESEGRSALFARAAGSHCIVPPPKSACEHRNHSHTTSSHRRSFFANRNANSRKRFRKSFKSSPHTTGSPFVVFWVLIVARILATELNERPSTSVCTSHAHNTANHDADRLSSNQPQAHFLHPLAQAFGFIGGTTVLFLYFSAAGA
ncbi:uncharacterized protein UBRO2_01356 [Ustilago bromivora]|uniref:Uncharacterized protein n=1 Tax=Ustilago bromivora TaxID=307758 RepID=A0A8H8QIV8_9BASI|nr:uncharacterized protein UBRO2_01356 [Ustilago bromivora]